MHEELKWMEEKMSNYIWQWKDSVKLKAKGTVHQDCTPVTKIYPRGVHVNNLELLYWK